jgi:hypothetical protein
MLVIPFWVFHVTLRFGGRFITVMYMYRGAEFRVSAYRLLDHELTTTNPTLLKLHRLWNALQAVTMTSEDPRVLQGFWDSGAHCVHGNKKLGWNRIRQATQPSADLCSPRGAANLRECFRAWCIGIQEQPEVKDFPVLNQLNTTPSGRVGNCMCRFTFSWA